MTWFLRLLVMLVVLLVPGGMLLLPAFLAWRARRNGVALVDTRGQDLVTKLGQYWTLIRWSRTSLDPTCTSSTK